MAKNTLQKINARAKAIRRAHPKKTWKDAQKQAGKEISRGKAKVAGTHKKRSSVGRSPAKRVAHAKRRVGDVEQKYEIVHQLKPVSGISYKGGQVKIAGTAKVEEQRQRLAAMLGQQIGWLEVALSSAKTEREKKQLRGKIARMKAQLRRINNHG